MVDGAEGLFRKERETVYFVLSAEKAIKKREYRGCERTCGTPFFQEVFQICVLAAGIAAGVAASAADSIAVTAAAQNQDQEDDPIASVVAVTASIADSTAASASIIVAAAQQQKNNDPIIVLSGTSHRESPLSRDILPGRGSPDTIGYYDSFSSVPPFFRKFL